MRRLYYILPWHEASNAHAIPAHHMHLKSLEAILLRLHPRCPNEETEAAACLKKTISAMWASKTEVMPQLIL